MAKIKIKDLPKDQKISVEEMKKIFGGSDPFGPPRYPKPPYHFDKPGRVFVGGGPGGSRVRIRPSLYEFPLGSIPTDDW